MNVLTTYERQFADEHHALVYRFLYDKGLEVDEFYDVVIFRYLTAVQRYLSDSQLQRYSFATIAYSAMNSAVCNYLKAEKRRRELCPITDIDYVSRQAGIVVDSVPRSAAAKLLWAEVASHLTERDLDIVIRKAYGATNREIGNDYGLAESTVSGRMGRIRRRLQAVLEESI